MIARNHAQDTSIPVCAESVTSSQTLPVKEVMLLNSARPSTRKSSSQIVHSSILFMLEPKCGRVAIGLWKLPAATVNEGVQAFQVYRNSNNEISMSIPRLAACRHTAVLLSKSAWSSAHWPEHRCSHSYFWCASSWRISFNSRVYQEPFQINRNFAYLVPAPL